MAAAVATAVSADASQPEGATRREPRSPRRRRPRRYLGVRAATLVVLVLMSGITGLVSWGAREVHNTNENRLLRQRVLEAAALLGGIVPIVQTPLASAAEVAEATRADPARVEAVIGPLVGKAGPFVSAAIWQVQPPSTKPLLTLGRPLALERQPPGRIRAMLRRAAGSHQMTVAGLLRSSDPRLAFAYATPRPPVRYVVYAESALPANGRSQVISGDKAFANLNYALYLGTSPRRANLLAATSSKLPLPGRRAVEIVPFGDNHLRLVMSPTQELGGTLLARLQWLVLGFGLLLACGAAAATERLLRGRERAEELAEENSRLYAAQRTVAETLQHSLLPERLPDVAGMAFGVRYVPGVAGVDIGGDWYDVIPVGDRRVLLVVGDVSGRGLAAGRVMASLRFAIRAYAAQGDGPATILTKLGSLLDVGVDGHFATVLCVVVDAAGREMTIANAGHPEPLLLDGRTAAFVRAGGVGAPIGVRDDRPYVSVTVPVPAEATLLAYTDGLIERRGETLDDGLERLRAAAAAAERSFDRLLDDILRDLTPEGSRDDIAILGARWTS